MSDEAATWWRAVVQLERVVDALTAVAVRREHSEWEPNSDAAESVAGSLHEMADMIRAGRASDGGDRMSSSAMPELEGISTDIDALRNEVSGLALDRRGTVEQARS